MPAAVVKGILLTIGIVAALGLAVLENPHIQAWLEEQRQRLIVLLRSIGDELDPPSRRAAEAFAFEGRTPENDENIRREASASIEAAAVATGRSLSSPSTIRRIPISGPTDPNIAEERARKGKEYLAQRSQKLQEMRQRKTSSDSAAGSVLSLRNNSFDDIVDNSGNLRQLPPGTTEMSGGAPDSHPISLDEPAIVAARPGAVQQDLIADSMLSAWQSGSELANPFGDEYALDRSITPRPPVPPKIALDTPTNATALMQPAQAPAVAHDLDLHVPGSFASALRDERLATPAIEALEELSYEEQLAIALSLSEQDSASSPSTVAAEALDEDADLRTAIANSLKDSNARQSLSCAPLVAAGPLIDLTAPAEAKMPASQSEWASIFQSAAPQGRGADPLSPPSIISDELYRATPRLTAAKLAHHNAQVASVSSQQVHTSSPSVLDLTNSPIRIDEPSFYSCPSNLSRSSSPDTIGREPTEETKPSQSPSTHVVLRKVTSLPSHHSSNHSEASIEVVEIEDSDAGVISDDGIATPDTWSEIGNEDVEMIDGEEPSHRESVIPA